MSPRGSPCDFNSSYQDVCNKSKEKLRENAEADQHVNPERVKTCMYNSFDGNSPRGENFTPVKTGGVSLPRGNFFFQFFSSKHCKGFDHTQGLL